MHSGNLSSKRWSDRFMLEIYAWRFTTKEGMCAQRYVAPRRHDSALHASVQNPKRLDQSLEEGKEPSNGDHLFIKGYSAEADACVTTTPPLEAQAQKGFCSTKHVQALERPSAHAAVESAHPHVTKSPPLPASILSSNGSASYLKIHDDSTCTESPNDEGVSSPQAEANASDPSRVISGGTIHVQAGTQSSAIPSPVLSGDTTYVQAGTQNSATIEQTYSTGCSELAPDCFLDSDLPLPAALQQEWESKIAAALCDAICQYLPDAHFTLECVMARSSRRGSSKPTVLLMCSESRHRKRLKKILRDCRYISSQKFERKVILLGNEICASGNELSGLDTQFSGEGAVVEVAASNAGARSVLFASLAKIYFEKDAKSTSTATIGGVISIAGVLYGLTTAHGIRTVGSRQQDFPELSGTIRHNNK